MQCGGALDKHDRLQTLQLLLFLLSTVIVGSEQLSTHAGGFNNGSHTFDKLWH